MGDAPSLTPPRCWRSRRLALGAAVAGAALAASGAGALAAPARAARHNLAVVYGVGAKHTLYASGTLSRAPKGAVVSLQTRSGKRITTRAHRKLATGRIALSWRYPKPARSLRVRVRVTARHRHRTTTVSTGRWRTLRLSRTTPTLTVAPVAPASVTAVPPAGQPGTVQLAGPANVSVGQVIAVAPEPQAPDGLLAKVTSVTQDATGSTFAETVPATLPEVVPTGAMDIRIPRTALELGGVGAGGRAHARSALGSQLSQAFSCTNGIEMKAGAEASLSAGVDLSASWHWGLPPSVEVRFEGDVTARAKVNASVNAEATCSLAPTALLSQPISLGTYTFSVGPVPVVVRPQAQLYLSASGTVHGGVATSAETSISATAGVQSDHGQFKPFGKLSPTLHFTPPTVDAAATIQAAVAPTLDVLLYGVAGPRIDLSAGLKLQAEPTARPWWRLTAPMSLGAQLRMDVLKLSSPRYTVWSAEPELAVAPGSGPSGAGGGLTGPTTRARIGWDTAADVDLHVWDLAGHHTYYHALDAIPGARLVRDIIPGFGPEEFIEESSLGRTFTFGLCLFNGSGATVQMDVTDVNGAQRHFTHILSGTKDAALITVSPAGAGYVPPAGWCSSDGGDPTSLSGGR